MVEFYNQIIFCIVTYFIVSTNPTIALSGFAKKGYLFPEPLFGLLQKDEQLKNRIYLYIY